MANDPLSKNLAAPPNDTEYERAHAEIMATEHDRRFLIEFAVRNRHPDTLNLLSALARLEGAIRDYPPSRVLAAFKRDLTELTEGIARIEAEAAAEMQATTSVSAADGMNDIIARLGDFARRVEAMIARAAVADGEEISTVDMSPPVESDVDPGAAEGLETGVAPAAAIDPAVKSTHSTPHAPAAPPQRSIPPAAPNDLLAALRALSEEEIIALFS